MGKETTFIITLHFIVYLDQQNVHVIIWRCPIPPWYCRRMGAAHFMFKLLTRSWTMCKGRQSLTRSMLWVQMKCIQMSEEMKNIIKLNSYVRLLVLIIFYLHRMKNSDFDNIKEKIICNGDSYKVCNCKKCKCRSVCSNLCNSPRRSKDHLRSFLAQFFVCTW